MSLINKTRVIHKQIYDIIVDRCDYILNRFNWSLIKWQPILEYNINEAVDGVPIDWVVRGMFNNKTRPKSYINANHDDLVKDAGVELLLTIITNIMGKNYIVRHRIINKYTIIIDCDIISIRGKTNILPTNYINRTIPCNKITSAKYKHKTSDSYNDKYSFENDHFKNNNDIDNISRNKRKYNRYTDETYDNYIPLNNNDNKYNMVDDYQINHNRSDYDRSNVNKPNYDTSNYTNSSNYTYGPDNIYDNLANTYDKMDNLYDKTNNIYTVLNNIYMNSSNNVYASDSTDNNQNTLDLNIELY